MAKRSRANRTEKATYQNIRNEHKYIDVVHHGDGHYYIIQYIKHELPERTVVNYMGTRCGQAEVQNWKRDAVEHPGRLQES